MLLSLYAQAPELSDDELYKRVLDDAVTLTGSAVGFFHLIADDDRTIALTTWGHVALGDRRRIARGATTPSRAPASGSSACARSSRCTTTTSRRRQTAWACPRVHSPVRPSSSVPVLAAGRVTAVFGVGDKATEYDETDVAKIELVGYELRKILDLRAAEAELHRAGEYNRSLFEASLDPMLTIGLDGMITDINQATVAAIGCSREELLGTDFADYVTEPGKAERATSGCSAKAPSVTTPSSSGIETEVSSPSSATRPRTRTPTVASPACSPQPATKQAASGRDGDPGSQRRPRAPRRRAHARS